MKSILTLVILCVLFTGEAQNDKTLLWGFLKPGTTDTSYVFGTIHMMPKKDFIIEPKVKKAFSKTSLLAMEVDLDIDLKAQMEMAKKMVIPNGQTLKDFMSEQEFAYFNNYCLDSLKISQKKLDRYIHIKPFFLTALFLKEEFGEIKSFEQEFDKMAKKQKKQIKGLETIQFQINLTDSISMPDQIKMLQEGLYSHGKNEFYKMTNLYLQEDLKGLYEMILSDSDEYGNFNELFLIQRNQKWIPVIKDLSSNQKVFIAVGAGHLGGETGILNLLQLQGYTVFPIMD